MTRTASTKGARPTQDQVRAVLDYEPETGRLSWKISRPNGVKAGDRAGNVHHSGYRRVSTCGGRFSEHRLIWLHVHGEWPEHLVDHINGVKTDNRLANLRHVVKSVNCQNQKRAHRDSDTGYLGVHRRKNVFVAQITTGGVYQYLGRHATAEKASEVYLNAKRQLHEGNTL